MEHSSADHVNGNNSRPSIAATAHLMMECDGSINSDGKGTWKGHVGPGIVFILWGIWWAYNTAACYLWQTARRPYRGRAWYPLAAAGRWLWYFEPVLKLVVPAAAVSVELFLDHDFQYRYLYCPEGTKYAGRFAMTHLNNWQHALSYPAFVLSGIADLLSAFLVPLPPGTSQALLGSAFASSSFIMYTHEKHEAQDKAVHWLLAAAMLLSAVAVFWEMAARCSVLAGAAKSAALVLQGAWLVQIAAAEFEGRPQWSTEYPGGAMLAPAIFSFIAILVLASLLALYLLLALLKRHGLLHRPPLSLLEDGDSQGEQEPLFPYQRQDTHPCRYDSAHHSEGDANLEDPAVLLTNSSTSDGSLKHTAGAGAGFGVMASFQIAHARSDTADAYV